MSEYLSELLAYCKIIYRNRSPVCPITICGVIRAIFVRRCCYIFNLLFDVFVLVMIGRWFSKDYKEAKQQGRSVMDYKKGIMMFFVVLAIMDIIF